MNRMQVFGWILAAALCSGTARAQCDSVGPVLTGFDFTPKTVDVTLADQVVSVTFNITDDVAGLERIGVTFESAVTFQSVGCNSTTPVSGTTVNGTYQCDLTIPRYSEAGSWLVDQVTLTDRVERGRGYNTAELLVATFPVQLQVSSSPDLLPPTLTGLTINPASIDVSAGTGLVACDLSATDDLSGIASAVCMLTSPGGKTTNCFQFLPGSGTPTNGTYSCDMPVFQYTENGDWDLSIQLFDAVGNGVTYTPQDLLGAGLPDRVTVTSVPEDLVPPSLVTFDLQPQQVNVENADRTVTCTARVTDNIAGTAIFGCSGTFIDTNFDIITQACSSVAPISGDGLDGVWECDLTIPQYSPGGLWGLVTTLYVDAVGNADFADTTALQLAGFPGSFDVVCGTAGPAPGPVLSWFTENIVSWLPINGATRYSVYGGSLNQLIDIDGNGLPDAGYGLCRNAEDSDLTDVLFADVITPAPGQTNFLLIGYDTATATDLGLGTTSGMLDRAPTLPCP